MIPLIAGQVAKEVTQKGGDKPMTNIVVSAQKSVNTSLIVTASIIGAIVVYYGGRAIIWKIQEGHGAKSRESKNANLIYTYVNKYASKGFFWWLNPLNSIPATTFKIVETVKGFAGLGGNEVYDEIRTIPVQDVQELTKAYGQLYHRDLLKDLYDVLGEENYAKIVSHWKIADISNTGYATYDKEIIVKDGKKITNFTAGFNSAYANKYGLVVKDGTGKYVSSGQATTITNFNVKKGNYAGISKGFSIGSASYSGGLVYNSAGFQGIYMVTVVNGKEQRIIVPADNVLLFDSYTDMNNYADAKGIKITNVII